MALKDCISRIIQAQFFKGDYFDSHAVINELLQDTDGHQAYLAEYPKNCTVAQYHGLIAQKIEESGLVAKVKDGVEDIKVKTHTIYGELSENQLWKRIEKE